MGYPGCYRAAPEASWVQKHGRYHVGYWGGCSPELLRAAGGPDRKIRFFLFAILAKSKVWHAPGAREGAHARLFGVRGRAATAECAETAGVRARFCEPNEWKFGRGSPHKRSPVALRYQSAA